MTTETVYGLQVNEAGGMARLAKSLQKLHLLFVVIYFFSGVLTIVNGLTGPEVRVQGTIHIKKDPMHEVLSGFFNIVVSLIVFLALRYAIQSDDRRLMTGLMWCDGCCGMCHCLFGALGCLLVVALLAGREHVTPEMCKCTQMVRFDVCDTSNACSYCFDEHKCYIGIDYFKNNFGLLFFLTSLWTILVCTEMICCTVAAVKLSTARQQMLQFSFCRATLPQGTGCVVVGAPIQGTILAPSAPKIADL